MKFSAWLRWLVEDYKAWRRKDMRVAPKGATGRIYERKDSATAQGVKHVASKPTLKRLGAKITRADGTVENYVIKDGKPVRID